MGAPGCRSVLPALESGVKCCDESPFEVRVIDTWHRVPFIISQSEMVAEAEEEEMTTTTTTTKGGSWYKRRSGANEQRVFITQLPEAMTYDVEEENDPHDETMFDTKFHRGPCVSRIATVLLRVKNETWSNELKFGDRMSVRYAWSGYPRCVMRDARGLAVPPWCYDNVLDGPCAVKPL